MARRPEQSRRTSGPKAGGGTGGGARGGAAGAGGPVGGEGGLGGGLSWRPLAAGGWRFGVGAALLATGVVLMAMLSAEHLVGRVLPGCGPTSGCGAAQASVYAKVPLPWGGGWPVAYVGLAGMAGLLAGWVVTLGRLGWLRWVAAAGGVVSVGYVVISVVTGLLCGYCLAANAVNVAFVVVAMAWGRGGSAVGSNGAGVVSGRWFAGPLAAGVAVALTIGLWAMDNAVRASRQATAAAQAKADAARVIAAGARAKAAALTEGNRLAARWRLGPEAAVARVVVFSGYQCPMCKQVETELAALARSDARVSLSVKHFPLSRECNRLVVRDLHPNGCWAARAAEAAGEVGGPEAFWRMHAWLFERDGSFTEAELRAGLAALGLPAGKVEAAMTGEGTLANVRADVEDGIALGLQQTPMIFVNGVEVRGWEAPGALQGAIQTVLASGLAPATGAADRPATAAEKVVGDWLAAGEISTYAGAGRVVIVGDWTHAETLELERYISGGMAKWPGLVVERVPFPLSPGCNPSAPREVSGEAGCLAARLLVAAGRLGGPDAEGRVAAWLASGLVSGPGAVTREAVLARAAEWGLDGTTLAAELDAEVTGDLVRRGAAGAMAAGLKSVPMLVVNGRPVGAWKVDGAWVLDAVLRRAAGR